MGVRHQRSRSLFCHLLWHRRQSSIPRQYRCQYMLWVVLLILTECVRNVLVEDVVSLLWSNWPLCTRKRVWEAKLREKPWQVVRAEFNVEPAFKRCWIPCFFSVRSLRSVRGDALVAHRRVSGAGRPEARCEDSETILFLEADPATPRWLGHPTVVDVFSSVASLYRRLIKIYRLLTFSLSLFE